MLEDMSGMHHSPGREEEEFEVYLGKDDFKFNAAHFVAFDGFRERLHGHNYQVSIRLTGQICDDGYVVDFGDLKASVRKVCKRLNERFLCPMKSDVISIEVQDGQLNLVCQDGSKYSMPEDDAVKLPIMHSTVEELACYIFYELCRDMTCDLLHSRGVKLMEVGVSEARNQLATFRRPVPKKLDDGFILDIALRHRPRPCQSI